MYHFFRKKISLLTWRGVTAALFTFLIMFAPSGNRIIFSMGDILGHPVESGSVSVFGMQVVALTFVVLALWQAGIKKAADTMLTRPASIFAGCVALFALLSSLQADDRLAGLSAAASVAIASLTYIAIVLFRPNPREVLTGFVGGAVFQTAIGGWQFFTQEAFASKWLGMAVHSADQLGAYVIETESGRWLRAYGSLSHPNVFGLYVGVGLLMCIGLAAYRGHGKHARFYAFMPFIAAGLLLSFSRSAILATVIGFVWLTISAFGSPAAPDYKRVLLPSFMIIAATMGVLGWLYSEPTQARATAQGRLETASISERRAQFLDASLLFASHPLTGVGVGQMPLALVREAADGRGWWSYDHVHNVPLLVAVDTGIIGFGAWAGFVVMMLMIVGASRPVLVGRDGVCGSVHRTPRRLALRSLPVVFVVRAAVVLACRRPPSCGVFGRKGTPRLAYLTERSHFGHSISTLSVRVLTCIRSAIEPPTVMQVKLLSDRVLVQAVVETESKSGIIIPETVDKEKPEKGEVIAVGSGKLLENGTVRPMTVKVGDVVMFKKYSPDEIKVDGKTLLILEESDVLAILG